MGYMGEMLTTAMSGQKLFKYSPLCLLQKKTTEIFLPVVSQNFENYFVYPVYRPQKLKDKENLIKFLKLD